MGPRPGNKRVKTRILRNMLVSYDERIVGEVLPVFGGFVYRHFRFGSKSSSALPTLDELIVKIDSYLKDLYE